MILIYKVEQIIILVYDFMRWYTDLIMGQLKKKKNYLIMDLNFTPSVPIIFSLFKFLRFLGYIFGRWVFGKKNMRV